MEELKPCPFCGKKVEVQQDEVLLNGHKYWYIKHFGCSFVKDKSSRYTTKEKAIAAWNERL